MAKRSTQAALDYPQVYLRSRKALRDWLHKHHGQCQGVWVVFDKGQMADHQINAKTVAEEAICFGWIDSLPRKVDAQRTMLLITPRRPTSNWSALNKRRVSQLQKQGWMTPAGLNMVALAKRQGTWDRLQPIEDLLVPDDLAQCLHQISPQARGYFDAFPPSTRRGILEWIAAAKKSETRQARIERTARLASENKRVLQWRSKDPPTDRSKPRSNRIQSNPEKGPS